MAQEPDNLVLQMLREIRTTLAEHSRFHEEHRQAFAELRAEMQQINQSAIYAIGLATLGQRDGETTLSRITSLESRVRRIEDRLDQGA